jgi:anti-sigma-K factor RskA
MDLDKGLAAEMYEPAQLCHPLRFWRVMVAGRGQSAAVVFVVVVAAVWWRSGCGLVVGVVVR